MPVWPPGCFYPEVRKVNGVAMYIFIILKLADGSTAQMAIPFADQQAVLATLRAQVPQAIFGFGEAQQAAYLAKRAA